MSKFKVGDKVKRVEHSAILTVGKVYEAVGVDEDGWLTLKEEEYTIFNPRYFELYEDKSKRRPHYDLIIAWANGAEIQFKHRVSGKWLGMKNPSWGDGWEYRIKPTNPEKEKLEQLISDIDKQLTDAKKRLKEIAGE